MIRFLSAAFLAATMLLAPTPSISGSLSVTVEGLRSKNGQVLIALHDASATFPSDWSAAKKVVRLPAGRANPRAVFRNLTKGRYAVIVVHDEDRSGDMTKNIIGFPREGFGSSNNPSAFGPPRFRAARFELRGDRSMTIRVVYL